MAAYQAFDPDELIRQHTALVRRIASHICSRLPANVELDDLFQEGMTGLLDAIQRYKPQPNLSFEAYASTRIRGAIYDACRRDDLLPRHQRDKLDQLEKTTRRLEQACALRARGGRCAGDAAGGLPRDRGFPGECIAAG
jgi:RNA polymerase sigma factor for flagellar operon FliA